MPFPSSVKNMASDPNYLDSVGKRIEEENQQNYNGCKIAQANRSFKSVILNSWNNTSDFDRQRRL
jgi:hypothetical protein